MTKTINIDLTSCFLDLVILILVAGAGTSVMTILVAIFVHALMLNGWM